jgi:S-DNA-T family DNA segregation ATPase FtsK/SpoIIIE
MAVAVSGRNSAIRPGGARRLISPALGELIRRRFGQLAALTLGLVALGLALVLASYNPADPSFDTATATAPRNLGGPVGAVLADLLLQGFGAAGVLPCVAMLAWTWRIASHRGLGSVAVRVLALLGAVPALAAAIAEVTLVAQVGALNWPGPAGPAGALGRAIAVPLLAAGQGTLGPLGTALILILGSALAGATTLLAFGLSAGEWRVAGRAALVVARVAATGCARAAGITWRIGRVLAWPFRMFCGGRRRPEELALQGAAPADTAPAAAAIVTAKPRRPAAARQDMLPLGDNVWQIPPLSLLKPPPARGASGPSAEALQANARLLESVLGDYGVQGTIREIRPGPVVTLYELEPAPGIRSARVIGLADDIARSLSVAAVRIATVPGRNVIGIEMPNAKRETVFLCELLGSEEWVRHSGRLPLALGKDIGGAPVVADLARMPHLLIAGTTGSGKSVGINAMILSLLYRLSPEQCRMILIDPKMLELSVYEGIPHLMAPVVTEPAKAVTALKWTVREMERRYRAMSQLGVRNIGGYNERAAEARAKGEVASRRVQTGFDPETGKPIFEEQPLTLEPLPFVVVVIDEMADLMMVAGKEIEVAVQRLAQMARAAGIHVIMATQRPSVDVITGVIKANFPTRISFQVISKFDSRTILGEQGAEQLLGQGDLLYMAGGGRITRTHGPFVSDREVEDVVAFLRSQGEPAYLEEVTEATDEESGVGMPVFPGLAAAAGDNDKGLFEQAVDLVSREGKASTSFVQRHLQIGYNRAARLIEQMEKEGIVSPANHVGKREVLVRRTAE